MDKEIKERIAAINSGIIPEGYKKTKVGIVPVEWEIEQIGKYLVEYKEKSTENNQYPVLTSSRKGLMLQTDYFKDRQVTTENNTGYNIIPYGYLTFRSRTDDGRFVFNKNTIIDKGIISYFYPVFSFKKKVDTTFMLELLNFSIYHRFMPFVEGTAQQVLSLKKLGNLIYAIPPFPEQQKIAEILSTQDKLIELQEKKIEQLKELKKAYLQKMFPKKGSKYPELRFKGFTDAWEQRKLSELFEERNEQAPMSDEYPLMAFIANIGVAPKGDRYDRSALIHDKTGKKYKRTEKGDFIYSSNNLETGSIGLNNYGKACISPVYSIFKSKHTVDPDFMGRILLRKEFIYQMVCFRQGVVYGQWKIHEDDFLNLTILVPKTEEQQKIGTFFSNLDNLITLHQRKSEQEKQKKKALMQLLLTGIVRTK